MQIRVFALSAALIACSSSVGAVTLPTHETYSAAADIGSNFFTYDPLYTPLTSISNTSGVPASIAGSNYTASASTTLGNNHAYAQASAFPANALGAASFSGWYEQVTITGGTGTGAAQFTVQLNGTVDVGAIAGVVSYGLFASGLHPSLLQGNMQVISISPTTPWYAYSDAAIPIVNFTIGASPYDDSATTFTTSVPPVADPYGVVGIPPFPQLYVDQILRPGLGQDVNITLHGTLNFTYGETFYLMGGLGSLLADGLDSFCAFSLDSTCIPSPKDGVGATTLDFANSANLVNISLPQGALASFASGTAYNVTAVPEPREWLMLLTGLGLVGWAARRRA